MEDSRTTPVFTGTGVIDGRSSISWNEAVHQARLEFGLIPPGEVGKILAEEGWGYSREHDAYVYYGLPEEEA